MSEKKRAAKMIRLALHGKSKKTGRAQKTSRPYNSVCDLRKSFEDDGMTRATINLPNELLEKFKQLGAAKWLSVQIDKADVERDCFFGTSDVPKEKTNRAGMRGRPTIYHGGRNHTTVSLSQDRIDKFRDLGQSHWLRKELRNADVERDKVTDDPAPAAKKSAR